MKNVFSFALFLNFIIGVSFASSDLGDKILPAVNNEQLTTTFYDLNQLPALDGGVQSRFFGPIKLQVWKHWQESWNVEAQPFAPDFLLQRGKTLEGQSYVLLDWKSSSADQNLTAELSGKAYVRTNTFQSEEKPLPTVNSQHFKLDAHQRRFIWFTDDYLDEGGKRAVTEIHFKIYNENGTAYEYTVKPMYVRGEHNFHWSASPDSYMAHAGSGSIQITNLLSAETGTDRWNGVFVKPVINFADENGLSPGAFIGLHRHEKNVERWTVKKGVVVVSHGLSPRAGNDYSVERQWSSQPGDLRSVPQFDTFGGWMEERILQEGEMSLIVPNPNDPGTVCFHGLRAITEAKTITDGTKN